MAETPQGYDPVATGLAIPIPSTAPRADAAEVAMEGRYVVVDAASARLYMIEDGRVRDTMRVIVGKPGRSTPALKSALRYATLNPYWNVPPFLTQTNIAPHVLEEGVSWLGENGYEVVSQFGAGAEVLDPADVDWKAVAAGREVIYVRERPGPSNSMGQIKFSLGTGEGFFLHDTNKKELFAGDDRNLSSGCVRLEDAGRFARWAFGGDFAPSSDDPEQLVRLPAPIPIVITYDVAAHELAAGMPVTSGSVLAGLHP